jgi:hypothetical protein
MTDQNPLAETSVETTAPTGIPSAGHASSRGWLGWLAPAIIAAALLGYGSAVMLSETIDDDGEFAVGPVAERESRAVAMAAKLVFREVEQHKWVANDPFFQVTWALDNMPAFQQGIVTAASRFAHAINEAGERAGPPDINLERAIGYFKYPGNVWMFDPSTSWAPTASSEKQYRAAARNLVLYNEVLGSGEAMFDRRPEALRLLLTRIGADMDAAAAELDAHMAEGRSALFDTRADDVFYAIKGRLYAYSLLMRELGGDFAPLLGQGTRAAAWHAVLDSLRRAAALEPLVVMNGAADSALLPSHLAAQGFHLLHARSRLAAIAASL